MAAGTIARSRPAYTAVAFMSASVLALQIVFTRIFSIVIWHHFTYLIVGIALLGSGAAGVFLLMKGWSSDETRQRLGWLGAAFSVSLLVTLAAVVLIPVDPLRSENLAVTIVGLGIYFSCLFTTFLFAGMVIAGSFHVWAGAAFKLYFADLFGAALSVLAVVWVIHQLGAPSAIVLVAMTGAISSWLLMTSARGKHAVLALLLVQGALLVTISFRPLQLPIPDSKPLAWALDIAGATQPEFMRWNPIARVDVVPEIEVLSPMVVGGVSSRYLEANPLVEPLSLYPVTLDGTSMTALYKNDGDTAKYAFLQHAIIAAPYEVAPDNPHTLLVGVGGGADILLAEQYDAARILAIDLNSDVIDLLTTRYADYTGNLAAKANVELLTAEGRHFLAETKDKFDVIQGIGLDNIAALNSGAYVLSESYLYTVEAFELAIGKLTTNGIFSWTRAATQPPIETLRLTGIAAEALRRMGILDAAQHILVVGNEDGSAINLLVSPTAFSSAQVAQIQAWTERDGFSILHDPYTLRDTEYARYLNAPDPRQFEAAYPFNIFPVYDDLPFYYNYFKWSRLFAGGAESGNLSARLPVGNLILLTMFGFSLLAAALFIVVPLWRTQRAGLRIPRARQILVYFASLGLAYMFVQIVLIQRFTLFIGYPTKAVSITIFSMLIFSALGSLSAARLVKSDRHLSTAIVLLSMTIVAYTFLLPRIFDMILWMPDLLRTVASVLLIAPLAFMMGIPFPTGIRSLSLAAPALVPWAWGVNGVFSVLGSVGVILISMVSSFTLSLLLAAVGYGLAALVASALVERVAEPLEKEGQYESAMAS